MADDATAFVPHHGALDVRARHDGWSYCLDTDDDGDVVKIEHFAVRGREVREIDFTPYAEIDPARFRKLVAMGFPPRVGNGPLRGESVDEIYDDWLAGGGR